jgi:clan AA aspartic protease
MGHVWQTLRLSAAREEELTMLVDTGATYSLISPELADRLGVVRFPERVQVTLANGHQIEAEVGLVMVRIGDRSAATPAIISPCDEPLLGVEALEALGLAVDPARGALTPTRSYAVRLGALTG